VQEPAAATQAQSSTVRAPFFHGTFHTCTSVQQPRFYQDGIFSLTSRNQGR